MGQELKLNEFKQLYRSLRKGIPWFDHLILGLLVWVEEWWIDKRVKEEVSKAIEEVELPPLPDYITPIYSEKPSDTSTSLPEMRLTAPWYKETKE